MDWLLKFLASYVGVAFAYGLVALIFGWGIAFVLGLMVISYCVGVLYGAGSEIRKREDAEETP